MAEEGSSQGSKRPRPPRSAESSNPEPVLEVEGGGGGGEAIGDLARMITLHGYDPSVVEDGYFQSFVRRLNPAFKLPSVLAVEEMCDGIFDEARKGLFSKLRRTSTRVSLSVGKAEAVEGDVFYTACHFIDDDWNLHRMVMDAYDHLPWPLYHGPLSGVPEIALNFHDLCSLAIDRVMAMELEDGVSGRDVLDRVFMVARDKRDGYIRIEPKDYIEQKFPSTYPRRRELIYDTYMDIVLCCIARRLTVQPNLAADTAYAHFIESEVEDLHLTRQSRQHLFSHLGLDDPRTYNERWYSCYCSLEVLNNEGSGTIPCLDSELTRLLRNIWGTIYRALKRISASSSPTSNLCLGELFTVREVLQSELARTGNGGRNADVLRDATDTLDRRLQESYLVWSIPLVLDPRYKLSYIEFNFSRAFGSDTSASYISEVTRKIKKMYSDYIEYDPVVSGTDSDGATVMTVGRADLLEQAWDEHCRAQHGMTSEVATSDPEAETELDRYLNDHLARPTQDFDILGWWKVHSSEYPTVARMARDALAMPTCSQLSSVQVAHVRSIVRGYSKEEYIHQPNATELCSILHP